MNIFALLLTTVLSTLFFPMTMNKAVTENTLPDSGVARELARARAANISEVRYALHFELHPGGGTLKAHEEVRLRLKEIAAPVVLDFRDLDAQGQTIEGRVSNVTINNQPIGRVPQHNGHLILPAAAFNVGENLVTLDFETAAATAGRSLIRYQDRDDGSEYLYTLFVPMDASLTFPCFDQPDLKAQFTLTITAPANWLVVANTREQNVTRADSQAVWSFPATKPISTYLFAFAAGPFVATGDEQAQGLEQRYFVRQSQRQRAQTELPEVMQLTRAGLQHFSDFFGHAFPFTKYDQVLLPGFAFGGMEHAGATFLREDALLFRTTPTKGDKLNRASLVLHELAHQWFGDLVTMRWFDDLWLKEGFANYMAYHALAAFNDEREMWKRFYQRHKPLAYGIDSTPGTTPIYQEVRNLKDAKSAYGAIVYQKAPSLLRALSFLIGAEKFKAGVQLFLRRHAYGNAEWNDLIRAFEEAAQQPLNGWANAWVKQRGMPEVSATWRCTAQGRLARLTLQQRDVLGGQQRWPLKTQLLLAYADGTTQRLPVQFASASTTVKAAAGQPCPAFVFGNDEDYGYGRFLLDARSRAAVAAQVSQTKDIFLRTLLWGALWESVREAQMPPDEFLKLVLAALPNEQDEELAASLLNQAAQTYQRYLALAQQTALAPAFEKLCVEQMQRAPALGVRITYYRALRTLASTTTARQQLKDLLAGRLAVPGMPLKQLDRWQIITKLLAVREAEAEALLAAERQRDNNDEGRKQAYIAEAARADAATKQRYFNDYVNNPQIAEDWIEGSLSAFNTGQQSALTLPYLKPALAALPQIKQTRKIFFTLAWLNAFIGGQQSAEALAQVQEFLRTTKLDRDQELKVLEVLDELERTVRIRQQFAER